MKIQKEAREFIGEAIKLLKKSDNVRDRHIVYDLQGLDNQLRIRIADAEAATPPKAGKVARNKSEAEGEMEQTGE